MRKCQNWLDTYMTYTAKAESPSSYHQWCAISLIAACLRRQVWVSMGHFDVYSNMYIVLVGPTGCRKSSAINTAIKLALNLDDVKFSADATTREALIKAIAGSEARVELPNNEIYIHSSLTIISKELSVFLGSNNNDLLALLTDLYDCSDKWEYRTKNMGIDTIKGEWLNMLAATTPTWLIGSVPMNAIGGGFTSRVIFVVEHKPRHRKALPILSAHEKKLREDLWHDLEQISMMKGEMKLTEEGEAWYIDWYEKGTQKSVIDARFDGYFERKHIHLLKTAIVISASFSNDCIITKSHLMSALYVLEQLEDKMVEAFGAAGRSIHAPDIDGILKYVEEYKVISREQLLKSVWRDISPKDIDIVIHTLIEMKQIEKYENNRILYYKYIGEKEKKK